MKNPIDPKKVICFSLPWRIGYSNDRFFAKYPWLRKAVNGETYYVLSIGNSTAIIKRCYRGRVLRTVDLRDIGPSNSYCPFHFVNYTTDPKPESTDPKSESTDPKPESTDPKPESTDPKPESTDPKLESKIRPFRLWAVYRYIDSHIVYVSETYTESLRVAHALKCDCALVRCDSTDFLRNV